jgi:hypothetical protein
MLRLTIITIITLLLAGCAQKKPLTQPVPSAPAPELLKPKPRPIRSGDYILTHPEILPDGSVVCHHPIQVIDSTKRHEDVTVYRCR